VKVCSIRTARQALLQKGDDIIMIIGVRGHQWGLYRIIHDHTNMRVCAGFKQSHNRI